MGWAPCFFAPVPVGALGTENDLATFRETVAVDLANQLLFQNLLRRVLWQTQDLEFCESLGADDGEQYWCQCVPCRSTDSRDAYNGDALLYKGRVYVREFSRLEHDHPDSTDRAIQSLWLSQDPARYLAMAERARTALRPSMDGLASAPELLRATGLARIPLTGPTDLQDALNRVAIRGILPDNARVHVRTRRLFVLMNQTARAMTQVATMPERYQGAWPLGTTRGDPLLDSQKTLLTFICYLDYSAPPIFEKDPFDPAQQGWFYRPGTLRAEDFAGPRAAELAKHALHPMLTPMVVGSRDLFEYENEERIGGTQRATEARWALPFWQHRIAPEHLNLRRWSLIAQQTGLYEYMYSAIAPRIYTRRLSQALTTSFVECRARVFTAEATPSFGLDGIRFYEAARLLWNTTEAPHQVREEYCTALCGPSTGAAAAMVEYFNALESIWCSRERGYRANEPPPQRYVAGFNLGTFQGYGTVGALGWITELEPFLRSPESRSMNRDDGNVPELGRMPFDTAWAHINRAWELCRGSDPALVQARERIQFFRRAFGMVGVVIRAFYPIWRAWTQFETAIDRPDTREPQQWATGWVAQFPPTTMSLAAQEIRARARRVLGITGTGLANWATIEGFRTQVRGPVHQYLTSFYDTHRALGGELGLGLSGVRLSTDGPIAPDAPLNLILSSQSMTRWAFWMRMVLAYAKWWDIDNGRRLDRAAGVQEDQGFGVATFGSIKKLIITMQKAGDNGMDRNYTQSITDFERLA